MVPTLHRTWGKAVSQCPMQVVNVPMALLESTIPVFCLTNVSVWGKMVSTTIMARRSTLSTIAWRGKKRTFRLFSLHQFGTSLGCHVLTLDLPSSQYNINFHLKSGKTKDIIAKKLQIWISTCTYTIMLIRRCSPVASLSISVLVATWDYGTAHLAQKTVQWPAKFWKDLTSPPLMAIFMPLKILVGQWHWWRYYTWWQDEFSLYNLETDIDKRVN